jgi:hypothetical protein
MSQFELTASAPLTATLLNAGESGIAHTVLR